MSLWNFEACAQKLYKLLGIFDKPSPENDIQILFGASIENAGHNSIISMFLPQTLQICPTSNEQRYNRYITFILILQPKYIFHSSGIFHYNWYFSDLAISHIFLKSDYVLGCGCLRVGSKLQVRCLNSGKKIYDFPGGLTVVRNQKGGHYIKPVCSFPS